MVMLTLAFAARLAANYRFTPTPGPTAVFDADGSALVIRLLPDDYTTDPAGDAGVRFGSTGPNQHTGLTHPAGYGMKRPKHHDVRKA